MKIFIDFDGVIFDTKKFKSGFAKIFLKNGISKKKFDDSYRSFKTAGKTYEPREHIKILTGGNAGWGRRLFLDFENLMSDLKKYVFGDALEFLKNLPKQGLYLISYGNKNFQKEKICKSDVAKYFKRIIITEKSKAGEIAKVGKKDRFKKDEPIIFIDDKPERIKKVKGFDNVKIFQMSRTEKRQVGIFCENADYCVKNFEEIRKMLNKTPSW